MADIKKKKKVVTKSSSRMTTKERMLQRKEDFAKKQSFGKFLYPKEGTTRVRIKSQGDDKELGLELIRFYLGKELMYELSPAMFEEPCPLMGKYMELKESKDEEDQKLATQLRPQRRYALAIVGYKDEKGKEIDDDTIGKALVVPRGIYQDIIELYLDEDEWGDMTDPEEGYDVKITRSGSGKNDTTYSVVPCSKKPLPRKYKGEVDLEEIVRGQTKSYDELEEVLEKWLNEDHDEEEEVEEKPKKKVVKGKVVKKKYKGDI